MDDSLPPFVMGHSADPLPNGPTQSEYSAMPVSLSTFLQDMKGKEFRRYNSNNSDNGHKSLLNILVSLSLPFSAPPLSLSSVSPLLSHYIPATNG